MTRWLLAITLLFATRGARADEVGLGMRFGLAAAPYAAPGEGRVEGLLTSLLLEASTSVGPDLGLHLRLPLVLSSVALPAGALEKASSSGNPEVAASWRLARAVGARLALGVPLTGGDASAGRRPVANQALALADALDGWRDPELFAPGRAALTPALHAEGGLGRTHAFADLKLPLLLRVRGGDPVPGLHVNALAIAAVAAAGGRVTFGRLSLGASAWATFQLRPPADDRAHHLLALAPEVQLRTSDHSALTVGSILPVAGRLAGEVREVALRFAVAF